MVAYNFQPFFAPQLAAFTKRQTIRAERKRHARPGEPVQLYQGMRTRNCVKLVDPDPICVRVRLIEIAVSDMIGIASIAIEGISLDRNEIELFAMADGFTPGLVPWMKHRTAREGMARFWLEHHGAGRFQGVIVQWEPT